MPKERDTLSAVVFVFYLIAESLIAKKWLQLFFLSVRQGADCPVF